jgi:hypothetical protein
MTQAVFDWDSLTIDEVELLEEITGYSVDLLREAPTPKGKMLKAMVFIVNRRSNPDFTLEDAGKVDVRTVNALTAGDDESPPTAAA